MDPCRPYSERTKPGDTCPWPNCLDKVAVDVRGRSRGYCAEHKALDTSFRASGGTDRATYQRRERWLTHDGYVALFSPDHKPGWVKEHRVVMERKLGRPLVKGESVHHINGIRHDNRPENLELWLGAIRYGQRATDVICPHCGVAYLI